MSEKTEKTKKTGNINIVVALSVEAQPLINEFKLRKLTEISEFEVFANIQSSIHLIISGIGNANSAAAAAFLHVLTGRLKYACFLNFGIAGSGEHEIGALVGVHKIEDRATGRSWFPSQQFSLLKTSLLTTVPVPEYEYEGHGLIDMEAAGFFAIGLRLVPQEQLQIIKMVSDNNILPGTLIQKNKIKELVQQSIDLLSQSITKLLDLSHSESQLEFNPQPMALFLTKWHFTQYQQYELKEILRRWGVILPHQDPLSWVKTSLTSKQLLEKLRLQLDQASY